MKDFEKYEYLVLSVLLKGHFPTMLTVNGVGSGKPEMLERCPAGGFRTKLAEDLKVQKLNTPNRAFQTYIGEMDIMMLNTSLATIKQMKEQ